MHKARTEVAAYSEYTEAQMMAMFGWTDPKMPAHYIAKANREKLGAGGMDKIVAFDQSQTMDDILPMSDVNKVATNGENRVVTLRVILGKNLAITALKLGFWCARRDSNPHDFTHCHLKAARLPIPPRALEMTGGANRPAGSTGADVTNR